MVTNVRDTQMNDPMLQGRRVLLGVTGGIAAYKAATLVRLLKKAGAEVQVLMTPAARRFITPLTLGTLSEREVLIDIFPDNPSGSWTQHIDLGLWADLFIVAPATADTAARLAHGFSDSMLTATALAARCPIVVCPAMDHDMYRHPATQANLGRLREIGYEVVEAGYGSLASGLVGYGRLPEPEELFRLVVERLHPSGDGFQGQRVLVTAGPTREAIDPVRFLSNHSSGKMGYALAEAAARRGAEVTLVSGPTALAAPGGVTLIPVISAQEMQQAVEVHREADVVIMAAAVSDYAPDRAAPSKIKKSDAVLALALKRTPDILAELGRRKRPGQVLIGFALETDNGEAYAREKLRSKNLDAIVLNNPREEGAGFGHDTNRVTFIAKGGEPEELPLMPKKQVAEALLDRIGTILESQPNQPDRTP